MKTIKTTINYIMLFLFLVLGSACSVEDGMDGDQGSQGEQGPPGEDGQDGEYGEDGNANVVASEWIEIEWEGTPLTLDSGEGYGITFIDIPEVDIEEFIETGGIFLAYIKLIDDLDPNKFVIYNLPIEIPSLGLLRSAVRIDPQEQRKGMTFSAITTSSSTVDFLEKNPQVTLRYVLVPVSAQTTTSKVTGQGLKWDNLVLQNYEEVMEYIEDFQVQHEF